MTEDKMEILNEAINVEVSRDGMLGVVSFTQPQNGGRNLTPEEITDAIREKGITYGLESEVIEQITNIHEYNYKYIIARGTPAVDGKDGWIDFKFDTKALKELKPKQNPDGTVDLRDLSAVKNVTKGDVLAVKVPASEGEDGCNVLGEPVRYKRGKDARIPRGKNTALLPDGVTLVADIDGKLEYDDHNIYINSVYNVMGDVDSSVGNINFIGDVVIYGSINSGFQVHAGGSVEVRGNVEDVVITAGEDIILAHGIQGTEKSRMKAGRDVITKFIQNATVEAGRNIRSEAILHSIVTAGDSIFAESGKGIIVGGNISATNLIVAQSIGSMMGTVTVLQIGVLPTIYAQHKQLENRMKEIKESLNKVDQGIKFLISKSQSGVLNKQQSEMLHKFNESRQPLVEQYEIVKVQYRELTSRLNNVQVGSIKFGKKVYPGVKVTIGSFVKYIDEEYNFGTITKGDNDIVIS